MHSWPHAPSKLVTEPGIYFVTAGTYHKAHFFNSRQKLDHLRTVIFDTCLEFDFQLQAWAIFSNHYHLIGISSEDTVVQRLTHKIHGVSARELNRLDNQVGRRVWYQMRDTRLTYEKSYLARLNYVHNNPSKHGFGPSLNYEFCSAHWFETHGDRAFAEAVNSFRYDELNIEDDY